MRELKFRSYTGRCFVFLDLNNDNDFTFYEFCSCLDDSPIEQYTGLKDKNSKEIYEGDIVEYDWYIIGDKPAYRTKEQVVFDDMGARLDTDRIRFCTNVEVIGNIHENPDLLEEKK